MNEETYCGPCSLRAALDAAEPDRNGIRIAVSTPTEYFIALGFPDNHVLIRRANKISGRTGSVMGTGAWLAPEEVEEFLEGRGSWRPA